MSPPNFNQNQNAWEIDVPGDNSCLFWAVALAYLTPVKDNHDDFQKLFKRLFGKKSLVKLEHVKNWIKAYNPFPEASTTTYQDKILNELVKTKFRRRVINYLEDHESQFKGHIEGNFADYLNSMRNYNSWGGELEIRAMSDLLDCCIQVISAGQKHSYGGGTPIQLFHVGALPDSPAANHYYFGLDKSLGDAYQSAIKPVIIPQPQTSEKLLELCCSQHIKELLHTLEKATNGTTNVSAVNGIGNTINANNIKVIGQQVILPSPPAKHLPEKWQVPPQNPDFTGRDGLLKQIADHFSKKKVPVVLTTTHGLGGIGKTQLAIEFVWRHYKQYKGVVWFNAENRNRVLDDYIRLGIELNILHQDDKDGIEERALLVKHWLEDPKHADWLLIYDNAPKYGGDDQEGVGDLFPTRGGKILITSRHTQWPQANIQVYVFTSEESRAYVQKVLVNKASDSNQVDTLATTLGHLPLALAQACAYIKKNPINITRYLELYETRKKELLSDITLANQTLPPDSNRAIVYITWDITMEAVRKESLLADKWLSLCAYLGSHDIPNFLLEAFAGSAENNLDSEIFETALGTLGSYSMLTINEESANTSIHRLVQEVIQLKSGAEERIINLITVFKLFSKCFPHIGQNWEDYTKRRQLLPHMEAFLPQWETLMEKFSTNEDKKQEMEVALTMFLNSMSKGYRDQGNWQKEREFLERVLLIKERHYGHDHPSTLNTRHNMASVLFNQGKYEETLEAYKEVCEKTKELLGAEHPSTLTTRNNMAGVLHNQGKYEEAMEAFKEVYEKSGELLGAAHPSTLTTRNNMAGVLDNQGKYEEAMEAYKEVYEKRNELLGAAHLDTLTTRNNMAGVLDNQGKYEEAMETYKEVYEKIRELLGAAHPSTLTTRNNMAGVLDNQGKYEEAMETYKEVYEKTKELLSEEHPDTLTMRNNMAEVLDNQGKYEEAIETYKEVYEKRKELLGAEHPDTLSTRNCMADVLFHQGKYEEAMETYKEVYEKRKELLGAEHPSTLTMLNSMASVLSDQGKYEEAMEAYKEVYEKRKELLGAAHPDTLTTLHNMAVVLNNQGKYEEAMEAYKEVYEKTKELLSAAHPSTLTTRNNMISVLFNQGKYQEAMEAYKEVYEKRKELLGAEHPDTLTTRNNMAGVLFKQGKFEEAMEAYKEVYEKTKELLGAAHPSTLTTRNNMAVVLDNQGKYEEAFEAYKEVYEKRKELLGAAHPDTLTTRNNISSVLSNQGKYEDAMEAYKEVYEKTKELLGGEHPSTLTTRNNMASVLFNQGKYEEAMEAIKEVYDTSKRVLGTAHPITINALQGLEQLRSKTASQTSYGVNDQLFVAVKNSDVQWVRDCIRQIANVNARDNNNWTPLHYAAENGYIAVVDILLQNHASINAENNGKATPFHFAVRNGHITVVEALLRRGAMVNATTQSNWTPLHFAAKQGHIEVVKVLLKYGADVNAKNKASKTALNLAAENNHLGLSVVLLNHDYINATGLNEQQRDQLTTYIFEHHPDHAELLISKLFSTIQI